MRILNRSHVPWVIFVVLATVAASWIYIGNFHPRRLPTGFGLPPALVQKPSGHHSVGGTPVGLIFGTIAFALFIFATLFSVRKRVVLGRLGTLQRWMRANIWLTLLTVPFVLLHSGFRLGGPMTMLLMALYTIVMVSGVYGLVLQHQMPHIMKERLPAETVFEQIPHIRAQLVAAAAKMRDSFKPVPPQRTDAGAPAPSTIKSVTSGSTPMASIAGEISTPTARAKTVVGSTITAAPINSATAAASGATEMRSEALPPSLASATPARPASAQAQGSGVLDVSRNISTSQPKAPAPTTPVAPQKSAAPAGNPESEAALGEFLERQVLPYLSASRGKKFRLSNGRYSDETFRFVKLQVTEAYRSRVEEIQSWCDERRMLDLQTKLHHWLHSWLFVHVPFSFLLLILTGWHAFVTLFYY